MEQAAECPECGGQGYREEDLAWVKCTTCNGRGRVTQAAASEWHRLMADVYAAERRYRQSLGD